MSNASIAVLIACVLYLFIVVGTNRGFIVAPRARLLLAQAAHCDATATILAGRATPDTATAAATTAEAIKKSLKPILTRSRWRWLNPLAWIAGFPLTKVAQYTSTVAAAEADLIDLVPDDDIDAWWATTHHHLRSIDPDAAKTLADAYAASPPQTPGAKRVFIRRAQASIDDTAATALSLEFDRQRVAFWLASVGLVAVAGIGLALGHELTMLVGALGGFLAPVVTTLTSKRTSVWGVMVLSPVGGALTAIGGLILVFFMASDPLKILGPAFATYWQTPQTPPPSGLLCSSASPDACSPAWPSLPRRRSAVTSPPTRTTPPQAATSHRQHRRPASRSPVRGLGKPHAVRRGNDLADDGDLDTKAASPIARPWMPPVADGAVQPLGAPS